MADERPLNRDEFLVRRVANGFVVSEWDFTRGTFRTNREWAFETAESLLTFLGAWCIMTAGNPHVEPPH